MTALSEAGDPPAKSDLAGALRRLGLIGESETVRFTPLTGGVSSEILLVETGARTFCVKRALAKLRVTALWEAPVGRNAAEAAWLRTVGAWLQDAVPAVLGEDGVRNLFAMQFLPPETCPVWKAELLAGRIEPGFAALVGRTLGEIHRRAAGRSELATAFANDATFEAIRVEPYLRATALRHPDLAPRLTLLADATLATRLTLIHGDVSPKNILCGPNGPVFLDAECAWYGDPAFDLAFCLNHLLLKGTRREDQRDRCLACFDALAAAYLDRVAWEAPLEVERRCAELLPGLLLARIDGKSPVDYLDDDRRDVVRRAAGALLTSPVGRLADIKDSWGRLR